MSRLVGWLVLSKFFVTQKHLLHLQLHLLTTVRDYYSMPHAWFVLDVVRVP